MKVQNQISRKPRREFADLVVVDPAKLHWHIRRESLSKIQFAHEMDIGRSTLNRMLAGTPVRRSTVELVAQGLRVAVEDLLPATEVESRLEESVSPWSHAEWEFVPGTQMPFVSMSNGLVMRIAKVQHRVLPGEFGRAKIYDITGMPSAVRDQCREALSRHATVCRQLRNCSYIAKNLTMTANSDQSIWTSVDEWFESATLEQLVAGNPLPREQLHAVMLNVAAAIKMLHAHRMVARELHPSRILVQGGNQAIVTDLELAKLLEVEGSVSDYWQRNHFRAPEVSAGESHLQADLYSFARIYLHAATGSPLDDDVNDLELLEQVLSTGKLRDQLTACLSPIWQERPGSITTIYDLLND